MSISVAIVEDNAGTRASLVQLLGHMDGVTYKGAYATGEEAVRGIPLNVPQVALVDINLPGMSGIECVSQLKRKLPQLQVMMLTTYEDSDLILNSLRAGASGYLLKNTPARELVDSVIQVAAGGAPMSMQVARKVVAHFHQTSDQSEGMQQLSSREQEVLSLLAKGCLYKEIAERLQISMSTVRSHIHTIYQKLHVQTRTEAVIKYLTGS